MELRKRKSISKSASSSSSSPSFSSSSLDYIRERVVLTRCKKPDGPLAIFIQVFHFAQKLIQYAAQD